MIKIAWTDNKDATDDQLNALLNEENYFGLFMLSRGVYDLRKIPLQEYYKKVMDLTDR